MFDQLSGLAYGIIVFAVMIGVGAIVLSGFGGATGCSSANLSGAGFAYNLTSSACYKLTDTTNVSTPQGTSYTSINYLNGQMGTTGLAGWTPAIVAISIGLLFLGAFMLNKGRKGRY